LAGDQAVNTTWNSQNHAGAFGATLVSSSIMDLQGKTLGILLAAAAARPNFVHALNLADRALAQGMKVYLYCIDEAVTGVSDPRLQELTRRGLKLFACAYGARRRNVVLNDQAVFSGLSVVSDLIHDTDRFVCLR
jgi:hypothetical protein